MKRLLYLDVLLSLAVFTSAMPSRAFTADDILINDFEAADYGRWKVEGTAFGPGPAKGTLPGQMEVSGYKGRRLVNSYFGGDGATGKLTSPAFTIERDYIKFLIGGGGFKGKTCMNLLIDGKVVLSATGPNTEPGGSEFLNWENWDVKKYRGRKAVLQIVDDATGGWGHINVDHILQSDTPAKKQSIPPPGRNEATPRLEHAQEIKITGKYLIFPVSNKGQRGRMTIVVGDQLVHNLDCDFPKNKDGHRLVGLARHVGICWQDRAGRRRRTAGDPRADRIQRPDPPPPAALRRAVAAAVPYQPDARLEQRRQRDVLLRRPVPLLLAEQPGGPRMGEHVLGPRHQPRHGPLDRAGPRDPSLRRQSREPPPVDGRRELLLRQRERRSATTLPAGRRATKRRWSSCSPIPAAASRSPTRPTAASSWQYYEGNPIIRHSGRDPKLIWYAAGQALGHCPVRRTRALRRQHQHLHQQEPQGVGIRQQHPRLLRMCRDVRAAGRRQPGEEEVGGLRRRRPLRGRAVRRQEVHARPPGQAPGPLGRLLRLAMLQQPARRPRRADRLGPDQHARHAVQPDVQPAHEPDAAHDRRRHPHVRLPDQGTRAASQAES